MSGIKKVIIDGVEFDEGEVAPVLSYWLSRDSEIVTPVIKMKSRSFLKAFIQMLAIRMFSVNDTAPVGPLARELLRDSDGFYRYITPYECFKCNAAIGDATLGTVVGTGNAAPAWDDYKLGTQVAHGIGAGQLQYGAMSFGLPAGAAANSHFRLSRSFSNNSGGLITVEEVGVFVRGQLNYGTTYPKSFLNVRDLFPVPVDIPDGQVLTVNYDYTATV